MKLARGGSPPALSLVPPKVSSSLSHPGRFYLPPLPYACYCGRLGQDPL
uniref:Uncharacterized protein n=1 Tax=Anguilla anguilla TaxID=7936 RepID=A0A0E9R601_ANGAN